MSAASPQWIQEVVMGYQADHHAQSLISKLVVDSGAVPDFTLVSGFLRYKGRIWIGNNPDLQKKLPIACHSSALGGHSGIPVTHMRMRKFFAWKGMKSDISRFIRHCLVCQQAKPDRSKLPDLLQPLEVPSEAWQIVSLDFVEGLPTSGSANCILVVIDYLTKYAHFIPLQHPFSAASVAKLFMSNVYKLHGMPMAIDSDRDKVFTSNWWRELFRLAGVSLRMSTSYHPQTDGQTERLNQTMETYLRCFANSCPARWSHWLPLAEFWYNTCDHSAIGMSPFKALYVYETKHFDISAQTSMSVPELGVWLQDRQMMNKLLQLHLARSRLRMKKQ
jgi:hypothetical protein